MAKTLKLVGLQRYVNPHMDGKFVMKGETAKFDDKVAKQILQGSRVSAGEEGERIMYWKDVTAEHTGNPTHDFTAAGKAAAAKAEDDSDEEAETETESAPAPASQRAPVRRAK